MHKSNHSAMMDNTISQPYQFQTTVIWEQHKERIQNKKACVIAAVVVFHEHDSNKLIFISIHLCYSFLPSGGKECRNA